MSYTPAPWKYEQDVLDAMDGEGKDIITDNDSYVVATILGQSIGDGYLIATAPELLQMLEALLYEIEQENSVLLPDLKYQAKNLIFRAKGKYE